MTSTPDSWLSAQSEIGTIVPVIGNAPASYAQGTAQIICHADPTTKDAADLQRKVADAFTPHYAAIIQAEWERLDDEPDHIPFTYETQDTAKQAIADAVEAAQCTRWASLLNSPEWIEAASQTLARHLATAIHVERLLFADGNPSNEAAQTYKQRFFPRDN